MQATMAQRCQSRTGHITTQNLQIQLLKRPDASPVSSGHSSRGSSSTSQWSGHVVEANGWMIANLADGYATEAEQKKYTKKGKSSVNFDSNVVLVVFYPILTLKLRKAQRSRSPAAHRASHSLQIVSRRRPVTCIVSFGRHATQLRMKLIHGLCYFHRRYSRLFFPRCASKNEGFTPIWQDLTISDGS